LSDDETRQLVHRLLDRSILAADVQSRLIDRAGGNPLYAEEFIRMLGERGLDDAALPETVQGVIAARLDGLSEEEKSVLQAASVVGKVFWLGAVVAVADRSRSETEQALHLLVRKEFVRRERRSSVGGESEYAFGHVLVRDVAYAQIPRANRAEMHHRAAEWVESLGRPEDHAELLAHHYATALEFARLAGQETPALVDETREALFEAADRALGLNAFSSAALFYERALDLAGDGFVEPHRLLRAGRAIRWARDGGDEILARAKDALVAAGDLGGAAEAEVLRADLRFSIDGDFPRTRQHIADALALVADLGPSRGKALVISQVARFNMLGFENDAALERTREALAVIDQLRLEDLRAGALNTRGVVRTRLGDPEGIADLERAVELVTRTNAVTEIGRAYNNLADSFAQLGDYRRAREVLEHGIAVMEAVPEQRAWAHWLRATRVFFRFESGEWDDALPEVARYLRDAQSGIGGGVMSLVLTVRAAILGARGELAAALGDCDQLAALADSTGDPDDRAWALAAVSYAQLAAGNRAEARSAAEAFFETIRGIPNAPVAFYAAALYEVGFGSDLVAALESRRSAYDQTARRLCTGDFEAAADDFAKIGATRMEAEARLLAARDLVGKGRRAEADAQLERALAFFRSVRAAPYVEAAESLVAATA
jgi:tetratricopeptide (TPR) repeat protein